MVSARAVSFSFCVFSGLFCGTNYVFSSWGPQMSQRCGLTAMAINMVGVSGNLGVYLVSPFSGKLVDKTGQRLALLLSSLSLFSGYYGLHWEYVHAAEHSVNPVTLCFYSFLTGVGSSLGNSSALNACAKSFPNNRGTSTAFPIAMYGLSAFLFSRISYMFFVGRTDLFLLLLAVTCGLALFVSSLFIGVYDKSVVYTGLMTTRKLSSDSVDSERGGLIRSIDSARTDVSMSSAEFTELTGWKLVHNRDFLLMITTIALLSGSGLMYINNLGNDLTALYRFEMMGGEFSGKSLEKLQALNVSALSLMNCLGRIFAGLVSDQVKNRFNLQRSAFLVVSSMLFVLGLSLVHENVVSASVIQQTCIIGFAYGCMFGIAPVLCSEMFGLQNFSTNWGLMSVFPGISGNIYNLMYGHVYDRHADPATHKCSVGLDCFREAFSIAMLAAVVATLSSTALFLQHAKKAQELRRHISQDTH